MMYFTNEEMKNAETFASARAEMDDSMFPSYLRVDISKKKASNEIVRVAIADDKPYGVKL